MNRPNLIKMALAFMLILVVVVATVNYGNNQRSKLRVGDARNSLPTIQSTDSNTASPSSSSNTTDKPNPSRPSDSQPKNNAEPAPVVQSQLPQSSTMPATGPADMIVPSLVLGLLSGMYLVSKRRLKHLN